MDRGFRKQLNQLIEPALELVYPPICLACDSREAESGERVCRSCWEALQRQIELITPPEEDLNSSPEPGPRQIPIVRLCEYVSPIEELIQRFKFEGYSGLGKKLAGLLAMRKAEILAFQPSYLIAAPLFPRRLKSRGFNQAQIVADTLSKITEIPVLEDSVRKVVNTKAQSTLSHHLRLDNLKDSFVANPDTLEGQSVLIVDDVITTGATITEIASAIEYANGRVLGAVALASSLEFIIPKSH